MKKYFSVTSLVLLTSLSSVPAHALLGDFRLTYGSTSGAPEDYNKAYYDFADGPKISSQNYLGADAILMLPLVPFGFGLRYEAAKQDLTEFAEKTEYAIDRTSIVLNYRLINTGIYVGPIATYGISHRLAFAIPTDPEVITAGKSQSYSVGLEAGVKLGLFRLGFEAGQMTMIFSDLRDSGGAIPNKNGLDINELNFSGSYYKAHFGFGF
jgi:hypothetical protein